MSYPSIYPTGTTIYDPSQCWNGYTIFQAKDLGALLIDMNGAEVKLWKGLHGLPNKMLPGGQVLGATGERNTQYGMQDFLDVVQVDWEGKITWRFNKYEYIEDPGEEPRWMARHHHDFQRQGNPVGYYAPSMDPMVEDGNTLILCHKNVRNPDISDKELLDDTIIEVNWAGEVVWEWVLNEHFHEFDWSEEARNILFRNPNVRNCGGDWMHVNSMSALGPNKWFDAGDARFHPDNIIWSARETNIIAITDKKTGKVVWNIGPGYNDSPALKKLGWIIGKHHAHLIPRGLPGEGNLLVFDNGGWAGFGAPNPGAPTGAKNALRDYSRVLEIDPTTLEIIWQYTPVEAGLRMPFDANRFYSPIVSSAQRLPNGNTLITEGTGGRLIEVTQNHRIVWEYISPHFGKSAHYNLIYRAYRLPYEWAPRLDQPKETPVEPVDITTFRIPGAAAIGVKDVVEVPGVKPYQQNEVLCVLSTSDLVKD
ncbi:MAG: aryl-sulfate sulfotransferase [Desulfarculaceae bacterium]|jgi:hypothetical protein